MDGKAQKGSGFVTVLGWLVAAAVFANAAYHTGLLLREADLWWHIKSGLVMLSTWTVPQTDTFSYTHAGQPWIAKEWLSQVIFAAAYAAAGWGGPLVLSALAIALTAWLIYWRAARDLQPVFSAVMVLCIIFISQYVTVARPHVFTFPLAVGLAILLFDAARDQRPPPLWSLLLIVLWANLHGSFSIAFLLGGCAFIDYLERSRLKNKAVAFKWVVYLALSVAVTLINPYFIKPYVIALDLAQGIAVMSRISEWAPFAAPDNLLLEAGLILVWLALLRAGARFTFGQILLTLLAFHMMLTHLRFIYMVFMILPVVLLPEMVLANPSISIASWRKRDSDGLEQNVENHSVFISGILALVAVFDAGYLLLPGRVVPPQNTSISDAVAFVDKNRDSDPQLQMKVFNDYNMGGPLILDGIKTYIDGRAEQLFLGDFMTQYLASGDSTGMAELQQILSDKISVGPSSRRRIPAMSIWPSSLGGKRPMVTIQR